MPTLRELQAAIAHGIAAGDFAAATAFVDDGIIPAADRLGIYRNTYAGSLNKAVCATYPAVEKLVGREFMEGAVALFVAGHPPAIAYLNEYGGDFPDFLDGFPPAASLPYLADVARVEWAIGTAANAPDAPALDLAALAAVPGESQPRLRFHPHPSLRLVRVSHDADRVRRAVLDGDDAALTALRPRGEAFWLLVHRTDDGVISRRLSEAEQRSTAAWCRGEALATVLSEGDPAAISALLGEHLAHGRFTAFDLALEDVPV